MSTLAMHLQYFRKHTKPEAPTQVEVAEKINVAQSTISKWERGEQVPDLLQAVALATLYGVTLYDFVNGPNAVLDQRKKFLPQSGKLGVQHSLSAAATEGVGALVQSAIASRPPVIVATGKKQVSVILTGTTPAEIAAEISDVAKHLKEDVAKHLQELAGAVFGGQAAIVSKPRPVGSGRPQPRGRRHDRATGKKATTGTPPRLKNGA